MPKKPAKKPAAPSFAISHLWIKLGDGIRLSAKLWLPKAKPVPALIEFSSHRKSDVSAARDANLCGALATAGYAVIGIDQRGTGDSEGNYSGGFDRQDETDALQALSFIAEQNWCDGKLGLYGFSAGGTAALQIARRQPIGLGAIIAVAATDDPYEDDGAYQGGLPTAELLAAATRQLAKSALPQDQKLAGKAWKKNWDTRLKQLPFMATQWLKHPQRDDEWKAISAAEDIGLITAPVLLVAGWQDAVAGASLRMMQSLRSPCKAIIGPWAHEYPQEAEANAVDFSVEMLRWFDLHLKGQATGVMQEPAFRYFMQDPQQIASAITGRWVSDMMWGPGAFATQSLFLSASGLAISKGDEQALSFSSPLTSGFGIASGLADGAARDDSASLTFDSAALAAELDIAGAPILTLDLSADAEVAQVHVRLSCIWPTGEISQLSQRAMNLTQRVSRGSPTALEPARRTRVEVKLADMATRVPKGCKLRISISTSAFPHAWPAPNKVALTIYAGASTIALPIRSDRGMEKLVSFAPLAANSPAPKPKRVFSLDPVSGAAKLSYATGADKHIFSVKPDDVASAAQQVESTYVVGKVKTVVQSKLSATPKHWLLSSKLEAFDGKKRVYTKEFKEKIPRNLV
ncbi:MAG TPA: CocE/NonD family hydrolase [Aestuariivirga sp.]